jgi:hypothetical protein
MQLLTLLVCSRSRGAQTHNLSRRSGSRTMSGAVRLPYVADDASPGFQRSPEGSCG